MLETGLCMTEKSYCASHFTRGTVASTIKCDLCGKVRRNTMKTRGLPWITDAFPRMISTDAVMKFYAATLYDMLQKYAGIQFTVFNS